MTSDVQKIIDALSKVESCIYLFIEEFDAYFQPKNSLKSTRGLRKLTMDEINSSSVFDASRPAYSGVGIYEVHIQDIRTIDLIVLMEEFSKHVEEEEQDEFYSLDEFLEEVKGTERLSPYTFSPFSHSKMIYSTNFNNEIKELKQGVLIEDIIGDEMRIDDDSFELMMSTRVGVLVGKKLFWLP